MALVVSADLSVVMERAGGEPVHLRLQGEGNRLTLEIDDPAAFAGSDDAPLLRSVAQGLASRGIVVDVLHDGRRLISIGAVTAPWWQRRVTGTRRIRIRSGRGVWTSARGRARGAEGVLPSASLTPAATLWPLLPTFQRRPRRAPTTTHDPDRGGAARLVLVRENVKAGERQPILWLEDGMTIGSASTCDVVLPGLAGVHAKVVHDERDEWVVVEVGGLVRVHGAAVQSSVLRSGARVALGEHQLAYYRDEHADHGRPHGGRLGGEVGVQLPQAPRHEVQRGAEARDEGTP